MIYNPDQTDTVSYFAENPIELIQGLSVDPSSTEAAIGKLQIRPLIADSFDQLYSQAIDDPNLAHDLLKSITFIGNRDYTGRDIATLNQLNELLKYTSQKRS